MNNLVIIGNGFDLAHLKGKRIDEFNELEEIDYKNCLDTSFESYFNYIPFHDSKTLQNPSFGLGQAIGYNFKKPHEINLKTKVSFESFKTKFSLASSESNLFIKSILNKIIGGRDLKKWIDLEEHYFKLIDSHLPNLEKITEINKNVNIFMRGFEFFLREKIKIDVVLPSIQRHFDNIFGVDDFTKTQILNFNYTNTVERYLTNKNIYELNYLHGQIGNIENPILFGYGDESSNTYKRLENTSDPEKLKHIKSYNYTLNSNFINLINFLESDNYIVHLMGHSCGDSDAVTLKTIFEHKNCQNIKVYFHQWKEMKNDYSAEIILKDDFFNKSILIGKRFENKAEFRTKLYKEDIPLVPC